MINWNIVTSDQFNKILPKDDETVYFLEDTRQIYKGNKCYTDSTFFVTDYPKDPIINKLYVNKITLETKIWDGLDWKILIPEIKTTLQDGIKSNSLVTGDAIKNYISNRLIEFEKNISKEKNATTDDIVLSKEINVTNNVGSYKKGDVILKGTTLTEILIKQLICRELPEYKEPKLHIRPDTKIVEVGSIISSTITAEFEKNDSGELIKYNLNKIFNGDITELIDDIKIVDYKLEPFMVTDTKELKFIVSANYKEGLIKTDSLGEADPEHRILEGTVKSELEILGKRNLFYGTKHEGIDDAKNVIINSNYIRSLKYNILDPKEELRFELNILEGDNQIIFAYPDTLREITSIYSTVLKLDIKNAFTLSTIEVEGANGYAPIKYKVYSYIPKISYVDNSTYVIII